MGLKITAQCIWFLKRNTCIHIKSYTTQIVGYYNKGYPNQSNKKHKKTY